MEGIAAGVHVRGRHLYEADEGAHCHVSFGLQPCTVHGIVRSMILHKDTFKEDYSWRFNK